PALVTFAGLLGAFAAGSEALAQNKGWWPAVFRDATRVTVIHLDVTVTDRAGRPVHGLEKEDFQLFEDGEPVEISHFLAVEGGSTRMATGGGEEESGEAATAPEPERRLHLVVFFDNSNLTIRGRLRALSRLRELLHEDWRPETRATLVGNERALVVRQPFTSDPELFLAALGGLIEEIEGLVVDVATANLRAEGPGALEVDSSSGVEAEAHIRSTLRILGRLVDSVAALPGRKVVLYVSDGLDLRPGEELVEGHGSHFELLPGTTNVIAPQLEAVRYDFTEDLLELVARANAGRTTFYTLNSFVHGFARRDSVESRTGFWNLEPASSHENNTRDSLIRLAEDTGGRAARSDLEIDRLLEDVFLDFDNHYSLGYVAGESEIGSERELEVRVRRPDLEVHHRSTFRAKSEEEKLEERTLSALGGDLVANPLGIDVEAREQNPDGEGRFEVSLLVKVPLGKLVLLPGEREHRARIVLFLATRDQRGRTSPIVKHLCPVRIPNSQVLVAKGRTAACGIRLSMRGGRQTVAVSVRDELASVDSTVQIVLDVGGVAEEAEAAL
ncbi:MAG: VWA domain-containing protein, partial [Planctomycetota bacterium]|nr:VWA domain-containing protein [Planctomycetota bacterium]